MSGLPTDTAHWQFSVDLAYRLTRVDARTGAAEYGHRGVVGRCRLGDDGFGTSLLRLIDQQGEHSSPIPWPRWGRESHTPISRRLGDGVAARRAEPTTLPLTRTA